MPFDEHVMSADELKFFESGGELQPSMQQEATAATVETPTPEVQAATKVETPATETAQVDPVAAEATEILRQQLAEAHRRVGALEENLKTLQQPPEQKPEPGPDPTVDPVGAMMHQLESVNKQVAALQAALKQQQDQQTQVTNFQQFRNHVNSLREEFVKTHADFADAYSHLRNGRIADLKAFGLSDAEIQKTVFQEEAALAQRAVQNAKNPAEVIYEMSKRHGYTPKATANSAATPPDKKLTAIQQAQAASKDLPSQQEVAEVTLEGLKAASDADLDRMVQNDKLWAKITGADQYPI